MDKLWIAGGMKVAYTCKPCAYRMAWVLLREQEVCQGTHTRHQPRAHSVPSQAYASLMPSSPYESGVAKRASIGAKCRVLSFGVSEGVAKSTRKQESCK